VIRSQIRTLASLFVSDPNFTRYTETQYNDAIDRAQEQFAVDSKAYYKDAGTYTVVAGTATYDLPEDFWLDKIVTHKGLELKPISRVTLLRDNGDDWTDDVGTPTHYIIDPEQARRQIRLYPIPQADDTGSNLILTYYAIPAAIGSDSASPWGSSSLMSPFHIAVAYLAAWFLLAYNDMTPEISAKMSTFYEKYQDKVTEAIDVFGNTKSEPIKIRGVRRLR
jgi:hypothetical protein